MRIAIVHGDDGTDVRVGKTCRSLVRLGHEVHFVGWDRRPGAPKNVDLGGTHCHVVPWGTRDRRWSWAGQVAFSWHVLRTLLRLRPDTVCAVNEDNAFRVLPFRRLLYRRLICDVFDSHIDRASALAWPLRWLLAGMSQTARWGCDRLVATDQARFERFGRHRAKTTVIANFPEDPGESLAFQPVSGEVKIYVSGALVATRGLEEILAAVQLLPRARIVAAGWPGDAFAEQVFVKHPRVTYHGVVSARRSLELAAACDAVLAFYAPCNRNNLLASPNKVYDAMAVGRPVIMNTEPLISQWVVDQGLGFRCPYDDSAGLGAIIAALEGHRERLPAFAHAARRLFASAYTWQQMERRLAELYGDAAGAPQGSATEPCGAA